VIGNGPIYCIHRNQDKERYSQLVEELSKLKEPYTIIEPVKAEDSVKSRIASLRKTTINLVKHAKDNNLPHITIIEDDCKINKEVYDYFYDKEFPKQFDFINLSVTGKQVFGLNTINKVFRKLNGGLGCVFYIIGETVYDEYLKLLEYETPIDEITKYLHIKRNNSYVADPEPAYHEKNKYSTLNNKIVKY